MPNAKKKKISDTCRECGRPIVLKDMRICCTGFHTSNPDWHKGLKLRFVTGSK